MIPAPDPAVLSKLKPVLYLAGLTGLTVALLTIERPSRDEIPSAARLLPGLVLVIGSLCLAANQWSSLMGLSGSERRQSHRAVYLSQLAKYLPAGGLVQVAGQVALTDSERHSPGRRVLVYVVGLAQLCAACAVVGLLVAADRSSGFWWASFVVAPLAGFALPAVLRRILSVREFNRAQRGQTPSDRKGSDPIPELPITAALVRGQMFAAGNILALAAAFAVIVAEANLRSALSAVGAFALAWLAGFVVFPIPAGIGIREAALVGLLPAFTPAQIVLAGLVLRLFGLIAEVSLLALETVRRT